jgi:hypothetical protein
MESSRRPVEDPFPQSSGRQRMYTPSVPKTKITFVHRKPASRLADSAAESERSTPVGSKR